MKKRRNRERTQYTAELVPIGVFRGNITMGSGYILIREDGRESNPVFVDNNGDILPEGPYMIMPYYHMKYLVVVPELKQ